MQQFWKRQTLSRRADSGLLSAEGNSWGPSPTHQPSSTEVCWDGGISTADRRRLNRLVEKASSVLGCPSRPSRVVWRKKNDGWAIIPDGEHVRPHAGHTDSTEHLLRWQAASPTACEGEIPQVLLYCCYTQYLFHYHSQKKKMPKAHKISYFFPFFSHTNTFLIMLIRIQIRFFFI